MKTETPEQLVTEKVYEFLGKKYPNFAFHVHFFTHGEFVEEFETKAPVYVFALRKDKGAKSFAKEYSEKFKEVQIPMEYEGSEYQIRISIECRKQEETE